MNMSVFRMIISVIIALLLSACQKDLQFDSVERNSKISVCDDIDLSDDDCVGQPIPEEPPIVADPPEDPAPLPPPPLVPPPAPEPVIYYEAFTQQTGEKKVDILFVVDNSDSMYTDQSKLAGKFGSFVSELSDLDYRIAITTTDITTPGDLTGRSGTIDFLNGTTQRIIDRFTVGADDLFKETIKRSEILDCYNIYDGIPCGSNTEQPLGAINRVIDRRHDSQNRDFLREEAHFATVIISDEDEMGNGPANATQAQDVINKVNATWPFNKTFSAYGIIIQPGDSSCYSKQRNEKLFGAGANYARNVSQLALMTGGVTRSICENDYSTLVTSIATDVRNQLLFKEIVLNKDPNPETLAIEFIPAQNITWNVSGRKVTFSKAPIDGTTISVSYQE